MFLIIEGIDGAGKHTQTQLLQERLESTGRRVGVLSFPRYGETFMARAVADYLNGRFGDIQASPPHFPALLFAGDRFQSRDLILHHLDQDDVLLVDRYVPSNMAHQAAKVPPHERDDLIAWIADVEYEMYALPRPTATFYLDVPVATAAALIARKKPRSYTDAAADLHERDHAYLAACRDTYERVGRTPYGGEWIPITCADAAGRIRPPANIAADIWDALVPTLDKFAKA
jgi:dTMP kinase